MKIVKFQAEHFKRLKVVEISPSGDMITLAGKNGSGKSSVLDAIYAALGGRDAAPEVAIARGEESARIRLDLGELVVTRKFTARDTSVVVEAANGARFPSPQRMLDDLIGAIAFDPLRFVRLKPKEQMDELRKLVAFDVDLDDLVRLNAADYEVRREINRRAASLRAQGSAIIVPDDCASDPVDAKEILDRLTSAGDANGKLDYERRRRRKRADDVESLRVSARLKRERAAELRLAAEALDGSARKADDDAIAITAELDGLAPVPDPVDAAAIRAELAAAEVINSAVARRAEKLQLEGAAAAEEVKAAIITETIAGREKERTEALAAAKFPIEGLALGKEEVLYRELPLSLASSGEQIRVSMAIAMAMNPTLRVISIREGSFLDQEGLRTIAEMAREKGYQVWVEDNRSTDPMAIVMEDGSVSECPGHVASEADPTRRAR